MKDRKLLELVAEAVGFNYDPTNHLEADMLLGCYLTDPAQTTYCWSPLRLKEDALDVMLLMELQVAYSSKKKFRFYNGDITTEYFSAKDGLGPEVRRAIVSLAIEVYKRDGSKK